MVIKVRGFKEKPSSIINYGICDNCKDKNTDDIFYNKESCCFACGDCFDGDFKYCGECANKMDKCMVCGADI